MQLPLSLQLHPSLSLESFIPGQNQMALLAVQQLLQTIPSESMQSAQFVFLWGRAGVGKTHLAHGIAQAGDAANVGVFVLDCQELLHAIVGQTELDMLSDMLLGLEQYDLVVLDNVNTLWAQPIWEEALFDLINRLLEQNRRLVLTSTEPPQSELIQLPDLRSRLCWGQVYQLFPLSDEDTFQVLSKMVHARGIKYSDNALSYLLKHVPRDMHSLEKLIDDLDELSLIEQKGITIPLIKQYLSENEE